MFSYAPTVNDNSGMIRGQGITNSAQIMGQAKVGLVDDIGGALVGLAGAYAENKGMEAEAAGYDRIGEILGGSMFKDNPAVGGYLADLRKQKDSRMKIAGYNALFNMAGPISNSQMAQQRFGILQNQPFANAGIKNATNIAGQGGPGMQRGGLPPAGAIFQ